MRGKELDPATALPAALAEKLAGQVGLGRSQKVVDPVVDLPEEA